jgi:hypothetical protein
MHSLPKILGYLGIVPFALFTIGTFLPILPREENIITFTTAQFFYSGMILSFLSGIHWAQAVQIQDKKRVLLSMLPTIFCLALSFIFIETNMVAMCLFLLGLAFALVYAADKFYAARDQWPKGYITLRLRITAIVMVLLFIQAGGAYVL